VPPSTRGTLSKIREVGLSKSSKFYFLRRLIKAKKSPKNSDSEELPLGRFDVLPDEVETLELTVTRPTTEEPGVCARCPAGEHPEAAKADTCERQSAKPTRRGETIFDRASKIPRPTAVRRYPEAARLMCKVEPIPSTHWPSNPEPDYAPDYEWPTEEERAPTVWPADDVSEQCVHMDGQLDWPAADGPIEDPVIDVQVLDHSDGKHWNEFTVPSRRMVNTAIRGRKTFRLFTRLYYHLRIKYHLKFRDSNFMNQLVSEARIWMVKNDFKCDNATDFAVMSSSVLAAFLVSREELEFREAVKDKVNWDNMVHLNKTVAGNLGKVWALPSENSFFGKYLPDMKLRPLTRDF